MMSFRVRLALVVCISALCGAYLIARLPDRQWTLERSKECVEMNGKPLVVPNGKVHVYEGCIIGV